MMAQRRLQYLKRRFLKSPQFFQDYKTFMEDIIQNGYARKRIITAAPAKTWFIPHHGVYNENKPGKIRVVFDCGAELGGKTLNKELIQWTRFKQSNCWCSHKIQRRKGGIYLWQT